MNKTTTETILAAILAVIGDTFINKRGERIEITKIGDNSIDYFLKGKKKGIFGKVYVDKFYQTIKPTIKAIPIELEPLAKEARKYKSAEEFFNNTPETTKLFRSVSSEAKSFVKNSKIKNVFFRHSDTPFVKGVSIRNQFVDEVGLFITKGKKTTKVLLNIKNPFIRKIEKPVPNMEELIKKGYDGIINEAKKIAIPFNESQIKVLNKNIRPQMIDFYNQAKGIEVKAEVEVARPCCTSPYE